MPSSGRSRYRAYSAEGGVERPLPLGFCLTEGLLLADSVEKLENQRKPNFVQNPFLPIVRFNSFV